MEPFAEQIGLQHAPVAIEAQRQSVRARGQGLWELKRDSLVLRIAANPANLSGRGHQSGPRHMQIEDVQARTLLGLLAEKLVQRLAGFVHFLLQLAQTGLAFFHRAATDEFVDQHVALLADAKGAVGGLIFDRRVPPPVEVNDV